MNPRYALLAVLLTGAWCGYARETPLQTKERYGYADIMQMWNRTLNPAGLSLDTLVNRGVSCFDLSRQTGSHARVQDGNAQNRLMFTSERYQKIGKHLYGYGRFVFDMGRQFDRSWSDVLRSHHSNPYFSGSSVKGKYDFQNIGLTASLATLPIRRFTFGLRADYEVGDLSRLKDPRSRTNLADYRLLPSVTFTLRRHTLGLSGYYHRRKEKIPNITTVQTDPNLKYYTFTGMEHLSGSTGGYSGYEREFVNHEFGGELSYRYGNDRLQTLLTLDYACGNEDVWGDIKYTPGKYRTKSCGIASMTRIPGDRLLHTLDIRAVCQQGRADEYRQERVIEKDPVTGIESTYWKTLLVYNGRYTVDLLEASLHYRLWWRGAMPETVSAYAGIRTEFHSATDRYNLPVSSLDVRRVSAQLEGGCSFLRADDRSLWVEAEAGCSLAASAELVLDDPTTEYAQQVLLPDMTYYGASCLYGKLHVQYQLPVTIKNHTTVWFVRATGACLKSDKKTDSLYLGFSFGLYY